MHYLELHSELLAITRVIPAWIEQVAETYTQDPKCMDLITKLSVDTNAAPHYSFKNGILRFKGRVYIGNTDSLKQQLLETFHKSTLGGHSGERATYQRLKLVFHWPNMNQEVKRLHQSLSCVSEKQGRAHSISRLIRAFTCS